MSSGWLPALTFPCSSLVDFDLGSWDQPKSVEDFLDTVEALRMGVELRTSKLFVKMRQEQGEKCVFEVGPWV